MPPRYRDLAHALERHGFVFAHGRGSHRTFIHPTTGTCVTIPEHREMTPGDLNAVRRALADALGISRKDARGMV